MTGNNQLRERVQEITAEYWQTRETETERVCVAQLVIALARAELGGFLSVGGPVPSEYEGIGYYAPAAVPPRGGDDGR